MIDPALRKLRLDRRMLDRRGWIGRQDLERALAELPDVSSKIAPAEDTAEIAESPAPDATGASR